jgi:phage terminase large subunit GpA-like protein
VVLAETWKDRGEAPDWKRLYERRESYSINSIPEGIVFLTAGVDIQATRIEALVLGWCEDRQSYAIDYRVFPGDTSTDAPWKKLDELLNSYWALPNGVNIGITMMAVDSGYQTQQCYSWARTKPIDRVMVVKGRDSSSFVLGQPTAVDVAHRGKKITNGLMLWPVGTITIKSELYSWLKLDKPVDNEPYPPSCVHTPEFGEEFYKQLTAEQVVSRVVKGYRRYQWEKTRDRNEVLDNFVYARAAAAQVGLDRMTKEQWQTLRENLGHCVEKEEPRPVFNPYEGWLSDVPDDWL